MATKIVQRLNPKTSALLLCDMQEKFRKTVSHFDQIVSVSNRMLKAAQILDVPVVATEQYPKGLGRTVAELGLKEANVPIFEKTCFTMMCDQVQNHLKSATPNAKSILLCGIETQACIFQTTLDLLEKGYNVHLVVDAISSRSQVDRMFALRQLEKAGAVLTTSECTFFALVRDATHPKFKEIQKLIATSAPDSGLLSFNTTK